MFRVQNTIVEMIILSISGTGALAETDASSR